jgi:AraC-like DNA-binding protein
MKTSFSPCLDAASGLLIKAYWQTKGSPAYTRETIIPKGDVELIFSFGDRVGFRRKEEKLTADTPRCFVHGIGDTPLHLSIPKEQFFFGVVLHPTALKKMVAIPCGHLKNTVSDLETMNPAFTPLWHQLAEAGSFRERIAIMEAWTETKIADVNAQERALSSFLHTGLSATSVTDLAKELCYSPRQLQRKSHEFFGMNPEALLGYKRYLKALKLLHGPEESLTGIGYLSGYYDQAHFIREFKTYTSLTPGDYQKNKSHLPGHLYQ